MGFLAALISALAQTFMNISIKAVRKQTGYSPTKTFTGLAVFCTFMTIPLLLYQSILPIIPDFLVDGIMSIIGVSKDNYVSKGGDISSSLQLIIDTVKTASSGDIWSAFLT